MNVGPYKIRISDINYGGHMGNDRALSLFQDARLDYLDKFGLSEKDIGDGNGIILTQAHIDFKREVFLNDELNATVRIDNLRSRSFEMHYEFMRESDKKVVFQGLTVFVCYDYKNRKPVALPENFSQKFSG